MIAVTGATGHLGRLVVEGLLGKVSPKELIVVVRTPAKASEFAAKGVAVRTGDYQNAASLEAAFAGVNTLLLISSNDFNDRAGQHKRAIDAAKKAGVGHIVYTGVLKGPASTMILALDHIATEHALEASGVPFTVLRNGWYFENYTANLAVPLAHGFAGSAGTGRISAASRRDFAEAAVAVLTTPGHAGKRYELAGDTSFTMAELAAEVSKQAGKTVGYADMPHANYTQVLVGAGLPEGFAGVLADCDVQIAKGALEDNAKTLSKLIGRPTTSLADAVKAGLAK